MSKNARLRTCASCEWIFTIDNQHPEMGGCPKCGFGHYGARYVYGSKAYQYARSQKPWFDKRMSAYENQLLAEIAKTNQVAKQQRGTSLF
ncbi:hypothetical protein [Burkholderia ubonensis]|nr:hypothetical protein [Burkholderia ubonensis]